MEPRLKQILTLALRPDTGEGESAAALSAARRIVKREGMDSVWQPGTEKVVYRDREKIVLKEKVVYVYRDASHDTSHDVSLTVRARYLHSMIEHMFADAQKLGCEIQITSCTPQDGDVLKATVIKFTVRGTSSAVTSHYDSLQGYVKWMNSTKGDQTSKLNKVSKPSGIWAWMKTRFPSP
jgi:hypothetical protein